MKIISRITYTYQLKKAKFKIKIYKEYRFLCKTNFFSQMARIKLAFYLQMQRLTLE